MNSVKKLVTPLLLPLLLAAHGNALALSADEIMQKVEARDDGDNSSSELEMILIDKNQQQRVRRIKSFGHDVGKDTQRIMFFLEPADVRNTGFLTYDYDDANKDDDQWLYLPALRKSKRIATGDRSGSFMGSDFSYADMTGRDLEDYHFTLMKEDVVNGDKVWLIESKPRTAEVIEETGYEKSVLFVRQDNFVVIRAVHWLNKGDKLKYLDVKKLEQIDGIWVPTEMSMTTKQGKTFVHSTTLRQHNLRFNQKLDADMFSVRRLERGL